MTVLSPVEKKWASTRSRRRRAWWSKAKCVGRRERGHVEADDPPESAKFCALEAGAKFGAPFRLMSKTNSAHEMKTYKHGSELVSLYISDNWTFFSLYVNH